MRLLPVLATAAALLMLHACGINGPSDMFVSERPPADFEILLVGNSHSSRNDLPNLVARIIEAGEPGRSAHAYAVPRWAFLAERLDDGITQRSLESRAWTHVVLQAQKYSTSGRYSYPTDAAEEWIRRVRSRSAVPILFPEWARRGNYEEGERIYALHTAIAAREPACVAPVDTAWAIARKRNPKLSLYATDGNHANRFGTLLTAYVLAEVISGVAAETLTDLSDLKVDSPIQALLRDAASAAIRARPACTAIS